MKKVSKEVFEKQLEDIMDEFDFESVHKAMIALEWVWYSTEDSIPTISELRKSARRLLRDAYNGSSNFRATGGFEAQVFEDGISLKFVVSEWGEWN